MIVLTLRKTPTYMKKILTLTAIVALILGLASCSDNNTDKLLCSVPADADGVVVINYEKIVEDLNLKTDGDKVQFSNQLKTLFESEPAVSKLLSSGALKLAPMAFFYEDGQFYLTGFVADADAFMSFVEKESNSTFQKNGSFSILTDGGVSIAVVNDRFWICDTDAEKNLAKFMEQDKDASILSKEVSSMLKKDNCDLSGIVTMDVLTELAESNSGLNPAQMAMVLGAVEHLAFDCSFNKGEILATMCAVDAKGAPVDGKALSKYFDKINMGTINCLTGDFDMIAACGIKPELANALGSLMNAYGGLKVPQIEKIDGTMALGIQVRPEGNASMMPMMMAVKMAEGDDAMALGQTVTSMTQNAVNVSVKGSTLLLRTASFTGKEAKAGACLKDLEGAYFGYVVAPGVVKSYLPSNTIPFTGASLTLRPDGDSFKMEMRILTGSDKNSLSTLVSLLNAAKKENRL